MHIARTAATLALVLAAAGCGRRTVTGPEAKPPRPTISTPEPLAPGTAPRKGGNLIGSGY